MSDLDKEFDDATKEINIKLAEAAKALNEAAKLAAKIGLPILIKSQFLYDELRSELRYDNMSAAVPKSKEEINAEVKHILDRLDRVDVSDIEEAMSACGWSASSSYC